MCYVCMMYTRLEKMPYKKYVYMRIQNLITKQNPCITKTACQIYTFKPQFYSNTLAENTRYIKRKLSGQHGHFRHLFLMITKHMKRRGQATCK